MFQTNALDDPELKEAIENLKRIEFSVNAVTLKKINLPIYLANRQREELPKSAQKLCNEISVWLDAFCNRKSHEKFVVFIGPKNDIMAALVAKGIWTRRRTVFVVSGTEIAEWMQSYARDEITQKMLDVDVLLVRDPIPIATNKFEKADAIGLISRAVFRRFENSYPTVFFISSLDAAEEHYQTLFMTIGAYRDCTKSFKWSD